MNLFQVNLSVHRCLPVPWSSNFDATTFWGASLLRAANRDAVQMCVIVGCDPVVTEQWGRHAFFRDPASRLTIVCPHSQVAIARVRPTWMSSRTLRGTA